MTLKGCTSTDSHDGGFLGLPTTYTGNQKLAIIFQKSLAIDVAEHWTLFSAPDLGGELEKISAELGEDVSLADVIRRFIREGIDRYDQQKEIARKRSTA